MCGKKGNKNASKLLHQRLCNWSRAEEFAPNIDKLPFTVHDFPLNTGKCPLSADKLQFGANKPSSRVNESSCEFSLQQRTFASFSTGCSKILLKHNRFFKYQTFAAITFKAKVLFLQSSASFFRLHYFCPVLLIACPNRSCNVHSTCKGKNCCFLPIGGAV